MGMISQFINQNIKILNERRLLKLSESSSYYIKELNLIDISRQPNLLLDFSAWSDLKLYGYFYAEFVEVLAELAKLIEGEVTFLYEDDMYYKIIFRSGTVLLQTEKLPRVIAWDTEEVLIKKGMKVMEK